MQKKINKIKNNRKIMKVVVQRVSRASVKIDGKINGEIGHGMLVLVGFCEGDNQEAIKWMSNKIVNLRIFPDEEYKMNKSVIDCDGGILLISNFTLYGDVQKGFRPSFSKAAVPSEAEPLYDFMLDYLKNNYNIKTESGIFGAMMDVELINDGPVTIIIEK